MPADFIVFNILPLPLKKKLKVLISALDINIPRSTSFSPVLRAAMPF